MNKNKLRVHYNQFVGAYEMQIRVIDWLNMSPLFKTYEEADEYAKKYLAEHPTYERIYTYGEIPVIDCGTLDIINL